METAMEQQENLLREPKNKLWAARRRLYDGVTYKQLGEEIGLSGSRVSQIVKPEMLWLISESEKNFKKLEASITTPSDDLKYLLDERVILQETCALLMGGDEIKDVLNQLANL
jgi:transcriptional regulator with XRE-family HTH domain